MTTAFATTATTKARPRTKRKWNSTPYLLVAPTFILIVVFLAYPLGSVFYYSLQKYNINQPYDNAFIGLGNFQHLLADPTFWESLGFTARWVLVEVVLQLIFGLILALVVNEAFKGRGLARALAFSPWAVSGVLTTTVWLLIYNPISGWGNYLAQMGLAPYGVSILSSADGAFWGAIIAELWKGIPFFAILILADLQSISGELFESAQVDGANRVQRFVHITLPHLKNAIILTTLLRAVWTFNNVDMLYTLTGGGPAGSTTTLPLYVANTATVTKDFGYGSALTVAAFFILLFFSIAYLFFSKFGREDA
jgi:multiple sugar transport system permease protein